VGCTTTGTRIDTEKLSKIKEGVTTGVQAIEMFGKPDMVNFTNDRKTILQYRFFSYKSKVSGFVPILGWVASGINTEEEILQIVLDKNNVVEKYAFSEASSDINTGLIK